MTDTPPEQASNRSHYLLIAGLLVVGIVLAAPSLGLPAVLTGVLRGVVAGGLAYLLARALFAVPKLWGRNYRPGAGVFLTAFVLLLVVLRPVVRFTLAPDGPLLSGGRVANSEEPLAWNRWTEEHTGLDVVDPFMTKAPRGTRVSRDEAGLVTLLFPPGTRPDRPSANPYDVIDSTPLYTADLACPEGYHAGGDACFVDCPEGQVAELEWSSRCVAYHEPVIARGFFGCEAGYVDHPTDPEQCVLPAVAEQYYRSAARK